MIELAKKYSDISFFDHIKNFIHKNGVRIVLHIGANLILPGIGSALVEGFFALKKVHEIVMDLKKIYKVAKKVFTKGKKIYDAVINLKNVATKVYKVGKKVYNVE